MHTLVQCMVMAANTHKPSMLYANARCFKHMANPLIATLQPCIWHTQEHQWSLCKPGNCDLVAGSGA